MKLSEYIDQLEVIQRDHGEDVEVIDEQGESVGYPEYMDDSEGDPPGVVICQMA